MKGTCQNCNTEFNYMPSQSGGKFCSNKCQGEYSVKQRFTKGTTFRNSMRKYLVDGAVTESRSFMRFEDPPLAQNGEGSATLYCESLEDETDCIGKETMQL